MAKHQTLTVPKNVPQPASIPTPIDNMLMGAPPVNSSAKSPSKRPTSFNISQDIFIKFKTTCVQQGRPMSNVVEELMTRYINGY